MSFGNGILHLYITSEKNRDTNHKETQRVFYEFINIKVWICRDQDFNI